LLHADGPGDAQQRHPEQDDGVARCVGHAGDVPS
jgi:hypothetical protein